MRWTRSRPYLFGRSSQTILSSNLTLLVVLNSTPTWHRPHLPKGDFNIEASHSAVNKTMLVHSVVSFSHLFFQPPKSERWDPTTSKTRGLVNRDVLQAIAEKIGGAIGLDYIHHQERLFGLPITRGGGYYDNPVCSPTQNHLSSTYLFNRDFQSTLAKPDSLPNSVQLQSLAPTCAVQISMTRGSCVSWEILEESTISSVYNRVFVWLGS